MNKMFYRILFMIVILLISVYLFADNSDREYWRLHTYSDDWYYSGPGGPSGSSSSFHYMYNSQSPQLIDSIHISKHYWSEYNNDHYEYTVPYISLLISYPEYYVIQQTHAAGQLTVKEVIVKDNDDRFLSYAIHKQSSGPMYLSYRTDWTYDNNNRFADVFYYRNPVDYQYAYNGFWRFVTEYDSTNLKISETRYHSTDSLNWTPTYLVNYYYSTDSLPESFLVKEREPYLNINDFWFPDVVDNFQIDSLSVMNYENNQWSRWGSIDYDYNINYTTETIFVSVSSPVYNLVWTDSPAYITGTTYYLNGFLKSYSLYNDIMDIMHPSSGSYYYSWIDENTSVFDEVIPTATVPLYTYPNPFNTNLNIKIDSKTPANFDISIYNIKGQLIRSWKGIKSNELTWDGRDKDNKPVKSGVYLIKAKRGQDTSVVKVIKF